MNFSPIPHRDFLKKTFLGGAVATIVSGFVFQGWSAAQWLKVAPASNPAVLEMFRDCDRRPRRDMVPWAGEFAGKHLVSAVQVWRVTGDASLKEFIMDFALHFWLGERECASETSIYRSPVLLTYDRCFNDMDPDKIPSLNAAGFREKRVNFTDWLPPLLLLEFTAMDGRPLRLCDFASAGAGGSPCRSWLTVEGVIDTPFARANSLRSRRYLTTRL